MATFRVYLVGSNQPLLVDLPVSNVTDLIGLASHTKFIVGTLAEANEHGVYAGIMFPTCRIHAAIEAD